MRNQQKERPPIPKVAFLKKGHVGEIILSENEYHSARTLFWDLWKSKTRSIRGFALKNHRGERIMIRGGTLNDRLNTYLAEETPFSLVVRDCLPYIVVEAHQEYPGNSPLHEACAYIRILKENTPETEVYATINGIFKVRLHRDLFEGVPEPEEEFALVFN